MSPAFRATPRAEPWRVQRSVLASCDHCAGRRARPRRMTVATTTLRLAQDPDADALLARDPLALLVGMLLDQQFPMERAFASPYQLARRLERPAPGRGGDR